MNTNPSEAPAVRPSWDSAQKIVLAAAGVGSFITTLGTGLVNVTNPAIQAHFGVTLGEAGWVVTSYLLAVSALLLIFGYLGDALGYARLLMIGFVGFAASSVLCSFATHFGLLIAGRLGQGAFAAMLMAMGPALITTSFPGQQRGRALGVLGTLTYLGLSAGPIVGGVLAGRFGWQSVFLIHVPIALGALVVARKLPGRAPSAGPSKRRLDLPSAALWALGLSCLLFALSNGERAGWADPRLVGSVVFGVVILTVFVLRQRRIENPLMPAKLFENALFRNSAVAAFLLYLVSFLMMFVLPFFLRDAWHSTMSSIGLLLTVQPIVMAFVAPVSGSLSDRFGSRVPTTLGMLMIAAALVLISLGGTMHGVALVLAGLCAFGGGAGLFTTANNSAIMGSAPREQQGAASGLLAVARNVGMATGVAMGGVLFGYFSRSGGGELGAALVKTFGIASALAVAGAGFSWMRGGAREVLGASTPQRS